MDKKDRFHSLRRLLILMMGLAFTGCSGLDCGTGGCGNRYDYPSTNLPQGIEPVRDSVRVRYTQEMLDFLDVHLHDILVAALGAEAGLDDTIEVVLPDPIIINDQFVDITLGQGAAETYPTTLQIQTDNIGDSLEIELVEGDPEGLRITITDLPVGLDARFYTEYLGTSSVACDFYGSNFDYCAGDPECKIFTGLTFEVLVSPTISTEGCDPGYDDCLRMNVEVANLDLEARGDISGDDLTIEVPPWDEDNCAPPAPDRCSPDCSDPFPLQAANFECVVQCVALDYAASIVVELTDFLTGADSPLGAVVSGFMGTAIESAMADFVGKPAGFSDSVSAAEVEQLTQWGTDVGFEVKVAEDAFDVSCPTGTNCESLRGMDLILQSGAEAAYDPRHEISLPHPCVLPLDGQDFVNFYGTADFSAQQDNVLTGEFNNVPYHLGTSVSLAAINQALYGIYNAGRLCIQADGPAFQTLGAPIDLNVAILDLATKNSAGEYADPDSPALISMNLQEPPRVEFGSGTADDPHVQLTFNRARIDIYIFMYERYARLFSVEANISVGALLVDNPETKKLELSLSQGPDIEITSSESYDSKLLPDDVDSAALLASVVGNFVEPLTAGLDFDYDIGNILTDQLGVPIYVQLDAITTLPATPPHDYLHVYLTLTEQAPPAFTALFRAGLEMDEVVGKEAIMRGRNFTLPNIPYFYRLNDDLLRGPVFVEDGQLILDDPSFLYPGVHTVELLIGEQGPNVWRVFATGTSAKIVVTE